MSDVDAGPTTRIPGWPKCSSCGVASTRDGRPCSPCRQRANVAGHPFAPPPPPQPGDPVGVLDAWRRCTSCGEPKWAHDLHARREAAGEAVVVLPTLQRQPEETVEDYQQRLARRRHHADLEGDHSYLHRAARPTSSDAAERARLTSGSARRRVLETVVAAGEAGATDEELQQQLGMAANTERPRRLELCEAGYLLDSGDERPTEAGGRAIVWLPTLAGLDALEAADHG